ncbi:Glycerol-3-phosphate dehydrogenase [Patulibacter medicamentivorans]|uniref:Glycerol-3-phosphate dehydrogenase n=1 Tax=Patulibacter medicamentivorans TaxID=1097667 RepID=H0E5F3_9ACTN|nr:glycerol-3-phosphate dehydrogenase/oxidase [Patulibacter medicamentivorans]EHN11091.1 Glycerol-3-phosphate dehydrogenase [Patulibacter medicamentivorans]
MLERSDAIGALTEETFDVVVVGGGVTGAGVALDAASRGFSVALVERADYSSGTSSRSSKLVHGGLRYLASFDLGLVREALLERQINARLAPHLVTPLPLVVANAGSGRPDRITGVGLNLYDVLAVDARRGGRRRRRQMSDDERAWSPDRHRALDPREVVEHLPALADRNPTGGHLFYDCQTDDSRLVLTILQEAERFGAVCVNRVEVLGLLERDGLAEGVEVRDRESGATFSIQADNVVNATGVWADRLRPAELRDEAEVPVIRPSRGTHVTLPAEKLPLRSGAIVPSGGGRFMFALPWLGRTLVGTTDNEYDHRDLDHVPPPDEDVTYILDGVNDFFGTSLGFDDVCGAYAGVRPLISTGDPKRSVDISRRAELYETSSGMLTITGGKLTTWRRMAKQTVDRLVEREGRVAPCRTDHLPLGQPVDPLRLPHVRGTSADAREQLAARYGLVARDLLALAQERPELARTVVDDGPVDLLVEVVHAARHEQARSVGDALLRRTRLGLTAARTVTADGGRVAREVAEAMAPELGWDAAAIDAAVADFLEEARLEGLVPGGGGGADRRSPAPAVDGGHAVLPTSGGPDRRTA